MRFGLTGSLGSGKTTVSRMLTEHGFRIIDADTIAHEVTEQDSEGYREIIEAFGEEYIGRDGSLDRRKLAHHVFSEPKELEKLESIVHPLVRKREMELLEKWKQEPLVILSVPLLFEKGLERYVDKVIVVKISEKERYDRIMKNYGLSRREIKERLQNQMPQEEKVLRADYIIDNSGSLEETRKQVEDLIRKIA